LRAILSWPLLIFSLCLLSAIRWVVLLHQILPTSVFYLTAESHEPKEILLLKLFFSGIWYSNTKVTT
jgi:hypothetical protein